MHRLLFAPIHLDRVAHRLEGVKRKAYRKDNAHVGDGIAPTQPAEDRGEVIVEEIEVLEEAQEAAIGDQAHQQHRLAPAALGSFNQQPGRIIHQDEEQDDENVGRDKGHVEDATGHNKKVNAFAATQQKKQGRHDGEEDQEFQ